jgi:hypothetical protein
MTFLNFCKYHNSKYNHRSQCGTETSKKVSGISAVYVAVTRGGLTSGFGSHGVNVRSNETALLSDLRKHQSNRNTPPSSVILAGKWEF